MTDISGNDELNSLGYASSAPDFTGLGPVNETKPQDEADLPALIMVSRILAARRASYSSIESLTLGDITLENQLIINKRMELLIHELESLVNGTVKKVKEKLNER